MHPEIAPIAFCHHWTQRKPSLPILDEMNFESSIDRQLEFGRELVVKD